jgi:hypothetical protein
MLSRGVSAPARVSSGIGSRISMIPNSYIERAMVPGDMPSEADAHTLSVAPTRNGGMAPVSGAPRTPWTGHANIDFNLKRKVHLTARRAETSYGERKVTKIAAAGNRL